MAVFTVICKHLVHSKGFASAGSGGLGTGMVDKLGVKNQQIVQLQESLHTTNQAVFQLQLQLTNVNHSDTSLLTENGLLVSKSITCSLNCSPGWLKAKIRTRTFTLRPYE